MTTSREIDLTNLNREIAELETEASRLEVERAKLAKSTARAKRRHRYFKFLRWFRSPSKTFALWPVGVLVLGPFGVGAICFVLAEFVAGSFGYALLGFLLGALIGFGTFAAILYRPDNALLAAMIPEAEAEWGMNKALLEDAIERLTDVKVRLNTRLGKRRELIASDKFQRAMLLQRNWKAMRSDEWEDYLAEILRTLGAKVERTGRSGDQGVDLVVKFGPKCIAIQAKGYFNAVNNKAVQEVYAGMRHRGCNTCAVITNSRFNKSAKELSASTGCILIGEDEFPDFVMGKISLW